MTEMESKDRFDLFINTIPIPIEITCPRCGFDIELWADENETVCKLCGYTPFSHERIIN